MLVGGPLGSGVFGVALIDAERRDLYDARHANCCRGIKKRNGGVAVDGFDRLAGASLEQAGAVDHGVDAGEAAGPDLECHIAVEVGVDPVGGRALTAGPGKVAGAAGDVVPGLDERRHEMRADEA